MANRKNSPYTQLFLAVQAGSDDSLVWQCPLLSANDNVIRSTVLGSWKWTVGVDVIQSARQLCEFLFELLLTFSRATMYSTRRQIVICKEFIRLIQKYYEVSIENMFKTGEEKKIQTSKCQIVAQEERATNSRAVKSCKVARNSWDWCDWWQPHKKWQKAKKDREKNTKKRKVVGNR